LPIVFDGDVLFELSPLLLNAHGSSKMQGMDRKNDGHAWCKVITTNIENNFGLSFKKIRCLGHLHCVQDDLKTLCTLLLAMKPFGVVRAFIFQL
jgi:hypothetical protein